MYQTNGRFLAEVKIKTMYHTNGRFLAEVSPRGTKIGEDHCIISLSMIQS